MAVAAAFLSACSAGSLARASSLIPERLLLTIPPCPARRHGSRSCGLVDVGASGASVRRAPTVRRNSAAETVVPYVPGSGKYIAPDYLVVRITVHSTGNLAALHHARQSGDLVSPSLIGCFALFVVAEEGVSRGGGAAGEGAEEGAAHR